MVLTAALMAVTDRFLTLRDLPGKKGITLVTIGTKVGIAPIIKFIFLFGSFRVKNLLAD